MDVLFLAVSHGMVPNLSSSSAKVLTTSVYREKYDGMNPWNRCPVAS